MSKPTRSSEATAQAALSSALAAHGSARAEGLTRLSREHPEFAPGWIALAEEHLNARRKEDALAAARRALKLDFDAHRRFSPELKEISRSLIPERKREPIPEAPAAPAAARPPAAHFGRSVASEPAAQALQQASILVGYHRRTRLEELSQEHPGYAPIWIALAEETLAQRSVDQAMVAAEHAMGLDPSLEAVMSPPLARAWKYHRKEIRRPTPVSSASSTSAGQAEPNAAASAASSKAYAKNRPEPSAPEPAPAEAPRPVKPGLQKMLATALGLRSRPERIIVLEQLRAMDPDSDEVLFHLAKELALDNRADDARVAGDQLRQLSPERYNELYTWAAAHWASKSKAKAEQPSAPARARQGQDSDSAASPASPPSAAPVPPAAPESAAPAARRVRSNTPAPSPRPAKPANIAPLHTMDDDVEPTVKVSRPPQPEPGSPINHGKANAEFKTVVMNLSEMQRLADETRTTSGPAASVPNGSPGESDDTRIENGTPASPPVHRRIRQAPPDTYVDVRPRGRPRVADASPDTELQFKPPEPTQGNPGTARMDTAAILDDDRSSTMPPWLSNPRPWATPGQPPLETTAKPSPAERAPEPPRPNAPPPKTPTPRAHPRLVPNRKRPSKPSDDS